MHNFKRLGVSLNNSFINSRNIVYSLLLVTFSGNAFLPWFDPTARLDDQNIDRRILDTIATAPKKDINAFDDNGYTGIMEAALYGHMKLYNAFIAAAPDLATQAEKNFQGNTALHLAMIGADEHIECVDIAKGLIKSGMPIYVRNKRGTTPLQMTLLMLHTYNRRMDMADFLIAWGCQVNAQDYFGNTFLHYIVQSNDKQWMRDFGAQYHNFIDYDIKNQEGLTALDAAKVQKLNDDLDSVGYYLQNPIDKDKKPVPTLGQGHFGYKDTDAEGRTALMFALYRGNFKEAEEYIKKGADLNARDKRGMTIYHWALQSIKPLEALEFISKMMPAGTPAKGINDTESVLGYAPLHMVSQIDPALGISAKLAEKLVSLGALMSSITKDKLTLLDLLELQEKVGFKNYALRNYIKSIGSTKK